MPDINKEYSDLFEKYEYLWADSFNKTQGRGWNLLPIKPRTMEERNRIFSDYVKKGYAVHTENRYGEYYIYTFMMKSPETRGHVSEMYVSESRTDNLFREFAQLFGKYGQKWTDDFRKDQGRGWSELPVKPRFAHEYNKVFIDFAQKGYEVYSELRNGFYFIYVKKLTPEHVYHIDVIREIICGYRRGYTDAATAIENITEVVERM